MTSPVRTNTLDRMVAAVSPAAGLKRIQSRAKLQMMNESGFVVPGGSKRSMKGVRATPNSPDDDINPKLGGMRAIGRDLYMNSPLATSILQRHRSNVINSGLDLQARINREVLGITETQAEKVEREAEAEFNLWADSTECDYTGDMFFGELQGVALINALMSGDVWYTLPYVEPTPDQPYGTRLNLYDADLIRNPKNVKIDEDIQGGVERDATGRSVAIHVWNCYPRELRKMGQLAKSTRIPIYGKDKRRQVFQIANFDRVKQRRGVPLLAAAVEPLKQLTRLSEAQLMNALVSSFFSVFVRDSSGMGATLGPAMTPNETMFGGGRYSPTEAPAEAVDPLNGNDLEMGHGNVSYLDDKTDISIADPRKVDIGFEPFFDALSNQVTAAGGASLEQTKMHYTTSYTAARAALNDVWKVVMNFRTMMIRRMCNTCYEAIVEEALIRNRLKMPGYHDDAKFRKAWTGSHWIGVGMGSMDPLKEAKATAFDLSTYTTTREESYASKTGGRWEPMVDRLARENRKIDKLGIRPEPVQENTQTPNGAEQVASGNDDEGENTDDE